jgi:hypothetical protein
MSDRVRRDKSSSVGFADRSSLSLDLWRSCQRNLAEHRPGNRRERSRSNGVNLWINISSNYHTCLLSHHRSLLKCKNVPYAIPIYRVKTSPCRLLHQAQQMHVCLPISLPTSNAFNLERFFRSPAQSARAEAVTAIIPVQRLAKIIKRKTHAMPSRHPITSSSFSPLLVLAVVVIRIRLGRFGRRECRGTIDLDQCRCDSTPLILRAIF